MAPEWTKATRPLVLLFTAIVFLITLLFDANVDAQAGAYATGVLVLMTSAAVAVTLLAWRERSLRRRVAFVLITLVFVYTTVANVIERPDGVKIASWFIVTIILTSLVSRVDALDRARIQGVKTDETAEAFIREAASRRRCGSSPIAPTPASRRNTNASCATPSDSHHLSPGERVLFLEVQPGDVSEFAADAAGERGLGRRAPHPALRQPGDSERDCGAAALLPRPRPARSRTPTSAGPRAIRSPTCSSSSLSGRATPRR